MAFLVTLAYVKWRYQHTFQRTPINPLIKEIEIWKRSALKFEKATTEEEKVVRSKLLDYIQVLEDHLAEQERLKAEEERRKSELTTMPSGDSSDVHEEEEIEVLLSSLL